ncbi:sensor histidine kinase [Hymenobacter jejuensis]|nr:histidine kinase [Hymenobacter jejuensis]
MNDRRLLQWGIPLVSLLMLLPNFGYAFQSVPMFLISWSISLVYTVGIWWGTRTIWQRLYERFPQVEQTARRIWLLAVGCVLYASLATLLITIGLALVVPQFGTLSAESLLVGMAVNLVPTSIVLLVYESRHFFYQWELNVRRAEQLSRAGVQSQLEALQSQLDPHFLFNSLNTLSALIEPENEPAQQFLEHLSDVYRYVLLSRATPTVPLAEELAFVDTYLALHKIRFRDNLLITKSIPSAALEQRVAPLSVQLLVENALKHNVASREHPLHLHLSADVAAGHFEVRNSRRLRTAGLTPGTGMGLQNVRHRYELLQAPRPVEVLVDEDFFTVRLPLLPPDASSLPEPHGSKQLTTHQHNILSSNKI